ncbi:MAG: c-type cytochrome [Burkholderiaceae bacterium]|nr:c-type cytochrome [Burkholderiaceae bacterium]
MRVIRLAAFLVLGVAQATLAQPASTQAALPHEVPNTMAQRMQACVACHGEEGRATPDGYLPRIAGKPAGYLYEQLRNFREGRRRNAAMSRLLANLSDEYLREIATHFAALDLPFPPPQPSTAPANALARGEALVRRGDAPRELPACAACHGQTLTGVRPDVPGLLGLPRDYLTAQIGAWKNGLRHAAAPDCMATIAERLVPADISAIANWLASQPVPRDAAPVAAFHDEPPLQCGSIGRHAATPPAPSRPAAAQDATVERGAYLARLGNCRGCHTAAGAPPFTGGRAIDTPFGTVYGTNLTPDAETGIGNWSAEDFWNAMHEGRAKDGRLLYPAFPYPYFTLVTREDSDALYTFLRSVPAARKPNRPHALRFPFDRQASLTFWRAMSFEPARFEADGQRSAEWNRGAYLVRGLGHCGACHSPRDFLGAAVTSTELAGETLPAGQWYAPSLTDPAQAGVALRSIDEAVDLLKTGRSAHASVLGPMAEIVFDSLQHASDADLRAMVVFLRSLPQEKTGAVASPMPDAQAMDRGRKLYEDRCADCHGEQGQGARDAIPALDGNRVVTMSPPANLIRIVLDGGFPPATAGNPRPYGMPPFAQSLGDDELAALATFLRNAWGNRASAVSALDVLRHR